MPSYFVIFNVLPFYFFIVFSVFLDSKKNFHKFKVSAFICMGDRPLMHDLKLNKLNELSAINVIV